MIDQASFTLRGRNPDVLTCIANLSNDEVFTPPEFADRMLNTLAQAWAASNDGADIWADSSIKFLDPCTKSGIYLRQIAKRLIAGLETEIPDLHARVDHVLTRQVFGIGTPSLLVYLLGAAFIAPSMPTVNIRSRKAFPEKMATSGLSV